MDGGGGAALSFTGVGKEFGGTWVVEDLTLELPHGGILGLIGPSGSGKTTAMRLANGVYRPDAGEVLLLGRAPSELRPRERTMLGYLPQTPVLFEELSLWENLEFHASVNGVGFRRRQWLQRLLELVDLAGEEGKAASEASGGMRRRLALVATLVHEPSILMLDEPTAGIDPILRQRLWDEFRSLADEGRSLVVNTQYIGEAADCDLIGLLADGRLIALGPPEEFRRQASGGEVLQVEVDTLAPADTWARIAAQLEATSWEMTGPRTTRLVVADASAALALVFEILERHGLRSIDTEQVVMSYDDMFVALVQASRGEPAVQ